jgi:MFS family permease
MRAAGRVRVLQEPNYRRLFWGRTVSLVGDGLTPVALAFAILDLTGSASDLGIVLAGRSLVIVALVLVGGVYADRTSPRLAMLWADTARTVVMVAMGALLIAGVAQVWELAVLYAIEGAGTAFFNPASNAIVPQIVSGPRLQEANALLNLSRWLGKVVGPTLAGVLLALGSPGVALAADGLTFAVSAGFLLGVRAPRRRPPEAGSISFLAELRDGWAEFSSRTWLWAVVLSASITNAVFAPAFQVLGPTVAHRSLGGSSAWALIAAAFGAGALVGGVLALSLRPRRPLLVGEATYILLALPVALLALPAPAVAIAAGALVGGTGVSLSEILYETVYGQQIPPRTLSRVVAYDWLGSLALEPIGLAVVGPVVAGIGLSTTLAVSAAILVACQLAVVAIPSVRRLEAEPPAAVPPVRPLAAPIEPRD